MRNGAVAVVVMVMMSGCYYDLYFKDHDPPPPPTSDEPNPLGDISLDSNDGVTAADGSIDMPVEDVIIPFVSWPPECTDGDCQRPEATADVTVEGVDAIVVPMTPDGDSGDSLDLVGSITPEESGTMEVTVTTVDNHELYNTLTATVRVHELGDIEACVQAGSTPLGDDACVTSVPADMPFGVRLVGDWDGFAFPIAPDLAWTGLDDSAEPMCQPSTDDARRDVIWCDFPVGLHHSASLDATQRGVERTLAIAVQ